MKPVELGSLFSVRRSWIPYQMTLNKLVSTNSLIDSSQCQPQAELWTGDHLFSQLPVIPFCSPCFPTRDPFWKFGSIPSWEKGLAQLKTYLGVFFSKKPTKKFLLRWEQLSRVHLPEGSHVLTTTGESKKSQIPGNQCKLLRERDCKLGDGNIQNSSSTNFREVVEWSQEIEV